MKIAIHRSGTLLTFDSDGLYDGYHNIFKRIKYRFTNESLKYLDCPIRLNYIWDATLRSVILMLKKYPIYCKCFPELKKLVEKYEEVKYKPCLKPDFKYIEFYRYIDTVDKLHTWESKPVNGESVKIQYAPAMIHGDIDIVTTQGICTPSNNLEDILDLPIRLNGTGLPNELTFTLFEFLKLLEYSLCYEFDHLVK